MSCLSLFSRVKVQAYSNVSGSPVDEKMLLQVRVNYLSLLITAVYFLLPPSATQ